MQVLSITEVYEEILQGTRKKFPDRTWENSHYASVLIKYLIEEKLKWSREDICSKLCKHVFTKTALGGMFKIVFEQSVYMALEATYPGEYKPWELKKAPQSLWTRENGALATRWLIEEKLGWDNNDVRSKLDRITFDSNGLSGMMKCCFNGSPFEALEAAFPGIYKPWELKIAPIWTQENAIKATKWLIEEKMSWNRDDVCKLYGYKICVDSGLGGMLRAHYNGSPYAALDAAYPGEYMPWELSRGSRGFWDTDNGIEATKWLVEEKLGWTVSQAREGINKSIFRENGLSGMLRICFKDSVQRALESTYPVRFFN